jgi:flagellar biosynthesis GTPase FlhF
MEENVRVHMGEGWGMRCIDEKCIREHLHYVAGLLTKQECVMRGRVAKIAEIFQKAKEKKARDAEAQTEDDAKKAKHAADEMKASESFAFASDISLPALLVLPPKEKKKKDGDEKKDDKEEEKEKEDAEKKKDEDQKEKEEKDKTKKDDEEKKDKEMKEQRKKAVIDGLRDAGSNRDAFDLWADRILGGDLLNQEEIERCQKMKAKGFRVCAKCRWLAGCDKCDASKLVRYILQHKYDVPSRTYPRMGPRIAAGGHIDMLYTCMHKDISMQQDSMMHDDSGEMQER